MELKLDEGQGFDRSRLASGAASGSFGFMLNGSQIHGHEVMEMMLETGMAYTRESLHQAIIERFGSEARFYTCSRENMTAAELIQFLTERGKFVPEGDGFTTDPTRMCRHEEGAEHEHHHDHGSHRTL